MRAGNSVSAVGHTSGSVALLIWDDDTELPSWDGPVVLWRGFRHIREGSVFSLPEMVDKQPEELRRRYLAFVHQIGETRIGDETIVDRLELRAGLSYWWMTVIAQKDVYANSPYIYDVLKLFAFEEFARSYDRSPIRFCSSNRKLSRVLSGWCSVQGRHFEWSRPDRSDSRMPSLSSFYEALPSRLRAFFSFVKFVFTRLWAIGSAPGTSCPLRGGVAVFDMFTHLEPRSVSTGIFASGYWSKLVALLGNSGIAVNWLHWYYEHPAVPNLRGAIRLAAAFSKSSESGCHQVVDGRISLRSAARVVIDFLRLNNAGSSLKGVEQAFRPANSSFDLWELYKRDWIEAIRGPKAVSALVQLNILEEQLQRFPHQTLGLYIQENQPWEIALVQLWRAYGHGYLVGVAHTTVPFWDLRYVFDPRVFRGGNNSLPMPDVVALNGPNAIGIFERAGYPPNRYREVEALRYLYLAGLTSDTGQQNRGESRALKLLVLGDLRPEYTSTQMSFLEHCLRNPGSNLEVVFKPHPASVEDIWTARLPELRVSSRHISDELRECDAVFVGSATSSAADAYQLGVPVISVNDGHRINFSPLYGTKGVRYVNSPADLAAVLSGIDIDRSKRPGAYFTIDEALPRWKRLLADVLSSE